MLLKKQGTVRTVLWNELSEAVVSLIHELISAL